MFFGPLARGLRPIMQPDRDGFFFLLLSSFSCPSLLPSVRPVLRKDSCFTYRDHAEVPQKRAQSTLAPFTVRPLARDPRVLIGWPLPFGFGLDVQSARALATD